MREELDFQRDKILGAQIESINNAHRRYDMFLSSHKTQVICAYEWLKKNIPEIFKNVNVEEMDEQLSHHDDSKATDEEYEGYAKYYYINEKAYKNEYDEARNYHQKSNKHHWEYWIMIGGKGEIKLNPIDIPENYIIEMICDWWSYGWSKNALGEMVTWYERNKFDIILSTKSRMCVEYIIGKIERKLIELDLFKLEEKKVYFNER